MDRATVYYGALPRETDLLNAQQFAMVGLAKMAEATLGTETSVDGFTVTPTSPASLNVLLTAGSIYQVENLEASAWSSLPADPSHSILKQGIQLDPVTFGITPPATVGYSQVFLVEVQYADVDGGSKVLPYYNPNAPSSPYEGPGNAGTSQDTVRKGAVASQVKAGVAAATGTQVAPTADAGWVGLYTITVANGATTITSGNIAAVSGAPFIPVKLPTLPSAVQSGKWLYGTDTGTANAMVVALNPAPTALVPGMTVRVKKGAAANTGATTLDVGLGPNTVKRATGADLSSGDVPASTVAEFIWDGAYWQYANFQGFNATSTTVNNYTLTIPYAADSSAAANSVVASFTPAVTALAAGDMFKVKLANGITGPSTITINALTPKALVRPDGSPLRGGEGAAGQEAFFVFDGTAVQFVSANLTPSISLIAGSSLDLAGNAPGSTKTASWSASELIAETSIGGYSYKGANLSLAFNGAITGAGGIDTGAMPVSGDFHVYAIFNPTTSAWNTLGTVACHGRTYTGASAPAGYTASALLWSGKTDAGGNIVAFDQVDREVLIDTAYAFTGLSGAATLTAQSVSAIVPVNAKSASGWLSVGSNGGLGDPMVASRASGRGAQMGGGSANYIANYQPTCTFTDVALVTAQTLYWQSGNASNGGCGLAVSRYKI